MPGKREPGVAGARRVTGCAARQVVLIMEAMKMEHQITAPAAGVLAELRVGQGSQVSSGDVLAIVTADDPEPLEHR